MKLDLGSFFSSALISLIPIPASPVVMHCLVSLNASLVFSSISVYRCVSICSTTYQKNNETSMTLVFLCGCQQILQKCTIQLYSQITCYLQITLLLSTRSFIHGNELKYFTSKSLFARKPSSLTLFLGFRN